MLVLWQLDTNKKLFLVLVLGHHAITRMYPGDKLFTVGLQSNGELGKYSMVLSCVGKLFINLLYVPLLAQSSRLMIFISNDNTS